MPPVSCDRLELHTRHLVHQYQSTYVFRQCGQQQVADLPVEPLFLLVVQEGQGYAWSVQEASQCQQRP